MIVGWSIATHLSPRSRLRPWRLRSGDGTPRSTCSCINSDAGSRFTSVAYTERLAEHGIAPSVGSVGGSFDNATAESAIGLYKTELIRRHGPWLDRKRIPVHAPKGWHKYPWGLGEADSTVFSSASSRGIEPRRRDGDPLLWGSLRPLTLRALGNRRRKSQGESPRHRGCRQGF